MQALATFVFMLGVWMIVRTWITGAMRRAEGEAQQRVRKMLEDHDLGVDDEPVRRRSRRERRGFVALVGRSLERSGLLSVGEGRDFLDWLEAELVVAGLAPSFTAHQAIAATLLSWLSGAGLAVMLASANAPALVYVPVILLGLAYPPGKLRQMQRRRRDEIAAEVPFFIQELAMALSTGALSIDDALASVTREQQSSPFRSLLCEEFAQANLEYRLGRRDREETLRAVGTRTRVVAVETFVDSLIAGLRTGAPLVDVINEYGHQAREMWKQDVRSFIARREPIVTLSLVITMFGAFIIYAAPLLLEILDSFAQIGGNGR